MKSMTEAGKIFYECLSHWPLFSPRDYVYVAKPDDGALSFVYLAADVQQVSWCNAVKTALARVDLNWIHDTLYMLHIELKPELRGRGVGTSLYRVCEHLAEDLGCRRVGGYPSGWTHTGETRANWMVRRGYRPDGKPDPEYFLEIKRDETPQAWSSPDGSEGAGAAIAPAEPASG